MAAGRGRGAGWVGRAALFLLVLSLKAVAVALAVATPVLGVWIASSLAAYANGPIWAVVLAGLLLFPLLPLGWEGLSVLIRRRRKVETPRVLTTTDRLVLRTLGLNLAFVAVLLVARPEAAFTALQTRGDWLFERGEASWADGARRALFGIADRLEWVYLAARDNPYAREEPIDGPVPPSTQDARPDPPGRIAAAGEQPAGPVPFEQARWGGEAAGARPESSPPRGPSADSGRRVAEPDAPERPAVTASQRVAAPRWPVPAELHPVVASMPDGAATSIDAVARYIGERVPDDHGRVKAVHDWAAHNIEYDGPAFRSGQIPPQDAVTTFRTRKSVCAGYALLVKALGDRLGLEVAYIGGNSRDRNGNVGGLGHAWNAVKLGGEWRLLDATWSAGHLEGERFVRNFTTDYYLTPPEVFILDHFPDEERWQLLPRPINRGEFMRQPMVTPAFAAAGLRLIEPTRSQVTVRGSVTVRLDNPRRYQVLAEARQADRAQGTASRCRVEQGAVTTLRCTLPARGQYRVSLFAAEQRRQSYPYVGQILVNDSR